MAIRSAVSAADNRMASGFPHSAMAFQAASNRFSWAGVVATRNSPLVTMSASMPSAPATATTSWTVSIMARCRASTAGRPASRANLAAEPAIAEVIQPPLRPDAP